MLYRSSFGEPPVYNGPFDPFPDFTAACLSIFQMQARLTRRQYNCLRKFINHPLFNPKDAPTYKQAKRYLHGVRKLPIYERDIEVKQGRSSNKTTSAYCYSIKDILRRTLESDILKPSLYFGPGQKVHNAIELYHGDLWKESVLLGPDYIETDGDYFHTTFWSMFM